MGYRNSAHARNQILADLEDIKCSIITLQSITDSLFSVVNVEKSDSCLIVDTHNTTNRDYFTVGECVRFLFTSCDGSLNERVSAANE